MTTNFALSEGDSVLIFYPHLAKNGRPATATFDIATTKNDCVAPSGMPDGRVGTRICTNIDRAAAAELRDALNAWLARSAVKA